MLFSYPNVWNTCLLILRARGFRLFLLGDPDELGTISHCTWNAVKNGIKLRADNPIALLGLAGVYEHLQPKDESPYWWRIEGENVLTQLEAEWRKALDKAIASEPKLAPPDLPATATPRTVESHLAHHKPIAVAGIVENGVVRPLDPSVKLQEHARVIIVATEMN